MVAMFEGLKNVDITELKKRLNEKAQNLCFELSQKGIWEAGTKDDRENMVKALTSLYMQIVDELQDYKPEALKKLYLFDTWDIRSGLAILCDIDPTSLSFDVRNIPSLDGGRWVMLNGRRLSNEASTEILDGVLEEIATLLCFNDDVPVCANYWKYKLEERYLLMLQIWKSGNHTENRYPPKYFIDWAISKGMKPKWLDWAKENGLIDDDNKPEIEYRELTGKSRTSFQNVMAALFNELFESKKKENPKITKTELIGELAHNYSGYTGFSESFLKQNITQGQRNLGYVEEK